MNIKKLTTLSMLLALAVALNIIESMFPIIIDGVPGAKLGLANIVVLLTIYMFSFKEAMYVSVGRVFIVGLLRTGLGIAFFFSLSGAILSTIFMYLVKKYTPLSIIGVSIIGALTHSIGQILMAIAMLKTINVIFYLPLLLFLAIPTGIIVGVIAKKVLIFYDEIW